MSIAARFRTIVWAAGVAAAALGCYLVSLRVAAERSEVVRLDRRLAAARADIRQLSTELGTRSRFVQLERWNADVLALTAPKAGQYLTGEMQLASLAVATPEPTQLQTPAAVALQPAPAIAQVSYRPAEEQPASRLMHSVSLDLDDVANHAVFKPVVLVRTRSSALATAPDGKFVRP